MQQIAPITCFVREGNGTESNLALFLPTLLCKSVSLIKGDKITEVNKL